MISNMIDIIVSFLFVIGGIVICIVFYWVYQDIENKKEDKNKFSSEESSINDGQEFTEIFKNDDNNVIKRR